MQTEIEFKGIKLLVHGNFDAGEEGIIYDSDLSGLPPTPSSFETFAVFVENIDIFELFSMADLERIEELVVEKIENM